MKMDALECDEDYSNIRYHIQSKQQSRWVTVCLGLLAALLLLANIGQIIYHASRPTSVQGSCEGIAAEICEARLYNLSTEKEALLQRLNTIQMHMKLTELQSSYFNLTSQSRDLVQQVKELVKVVEKDRGRPCETGWKKFGANCYIVTTVKKNWTSSRHDCLVRGADLVTITSPQEQIFVNGLLAQDVNAWMGMIDSLEEGVWMWVDGTHVTRKYWKEGQPNSHEGNQDCGEFIQFEEVGTWNDEGCFAENVAICEK